ncbi:hypothetical protein DXG01_008041 [Tephrocybe rancida]|nr:hypothetical protein DXG01_008041 [Tephrocybe rancida]
MDRPTESDVVVDYLLNPMSSGTNTRDKELVETYRTLKRRYHELEEETSPESQAAGERNVKRREEQR